MIDRLFPGWALKRAENRAKLAQVQRLLEHDRNNKRHPHRRMGGQSGDAVMEHTKHRIRESARWLEENHDVAVSIIETLKTRLVGRGTYVEPMAMTRGGELHADLNRAIRRAWRDWKRNPDVTGEYAGVELERIVIGSWLRDGEVFIQHIGPDSRLGFDRSIQYSLELIESDLVPFDTLRDNVIHGVEKNTWGRPTAYWFYKDHPGNHAPFRMMALDLDTKRVPADRITHLKLTNRIGQTRGLSIFHASIDRLLDLSDYEDSERVAARVAACLTAFITRDGVTPYEASADGSGERDMRLAPGMVYELGVGEGVHTIAPNRPNEQLDPFVNGQLRRVAGGTHVSYSTMSRNYLGTYSSQRQEMVEAEDGYAPLRAKYWGDFLEPVYRRFLRQAVEDRVIALPRDVDIGTLYDVEFRGPALPWIDPQKESKGYELDLVNGFKSRHQIIRERGGDPERVTKELLSDEFTPAQEAPPSDPAQAGDDDGEEVAAA